MAHDRAQSWSMTRIVALLAAVFAVVLGATLPFAAAAAVSRGGVEIVLCSAEGPRALRGVGDGDDSSETAAAAKCAACVTPAAAAVAPSPPVEQAVVLAAPSHPENGVRRIGRQRPPSRAPPKPPATAPPHA